MYYYTSNTLWTQVVVANLLPSYDKTSTDSKLRSIKLVGSGYKPMGIPCAQTVTTAMILMFAHLLIYHMT